MPTSRQRRLDPKYKDNIAAIRIYKTMEAEGRAASFDERKQMLKYVVGAQSRAC